VPTSYQPSLAEQFMQLVHPQLVAVPAQMSSASHVPAEHESVVHAFPSLHAAQPVRVTRVSVIDVVQPVPLHVCVRYSWF
jgi:hypothetical protein